MACPAQGLAMLYCATRGFWVVETDPRIAEPLLLPEPHPSADPTAPQMASNTTVFESNVRNNLEDPIAELGFCGKTGLRSDRLLRESGEHPLERRGSIDLCIPLKTCS